MHLGVISCINKPTRLDAKGGQEVWAAEFILEEIKRGGRTFDLYAIKNSLKVPNKIFLKEVSVKGRDEIKADPFFANSNEQERDLSVYAFSIYAKVALKIKEDEAKYDLIIDSTANPIISLNWSFYSKPLIVIGHIPVEKRYVKFYQYFPIPNNVYFVFLSHFQYDHAWWIPEDRKFLIPNGIDVTSLQAGKKDNAKNLVWLGRIDSKMPKGAGEAVMVADRLHLDLKLYCYIEDKPYYKTEIEPLIKKSSFVNIVSGEQPSKNEIFRDAKLLLFPAKWEEPFPLVMLEALATGTPIVAFARGSLPEVIKDGETGFIINPSDQDIRGNWIVKKTGVDGLVEAVKRIYDMPDRKYRQMAKNCREHIEKNFTVEKMVDRYEAIYKKILGRESLTI